MKGEHTINKICFKCGKEKSINEFYKHMEMTNGYLNICKKCVLKRTKVYADANRTRIGKYRIKWGEINKEELTIRNKKYYEENKEKIIKGNQEYYQLNKKIIAKCSEKYYIKNKTEIKKQHKIYNNARSKTDINFRILCNLRARLGSAITKGVKSAKTLGLLGCSVDYLKQFLENKFKKGMDWENYGIEGWHIDHIIPCCSFDLTKPIEQRKCFNYNNLQPLWAKENRIKHTDILANV